MTTERGRKFKRLIEASAIMAYGVQLLAELDKTCSGDPQLRNVQALIAAPLASMFLRLAETVASGTLESTESPGK